MRPTLRRQTAVRRQTGLYEQLLRRTEQNLVSATDHVHTFKNARKSWSRSLAKRHAQVPIEELLRSDEFMGLDKELWPAHQEDVMELWERRHEKGTWKAYFNEGIGSGKTYKAGMCLWLLVYENIIREDPLGYYGLGKGGGIGLICMSRNYSLSKDVTFRKIAPFFNCPFFDTYFPCQINWSELDEMKRLPDALYFPKRIAIWAGGGNSMCLTNTLVKTEDGYQRIEDMENYSRRVFSYNPQTHAVELVNFGGWKRYPATRVLKVTLEDGTSITGTPDHKMLIRTLSGSEEWRCLEDLRRGDDLVEVSK